MSKKIISFITSLSVMFSLLSFLPNKLLINIIASAYNASNAVSYANTYWSNYNPNYSNYNSIGGDCANFVSQCLVAGGMQMTDGWYWYSYSNRSASWSACASMYNYFKNSGYEIIENPSDSQVIEGNPVLYYSSSKGRWSHAAICTGHDSSGNALVSAHNSDRHNVNWKLGTNWSKRCTIIINGNDPEPEKWYDDLTPINLGNGFYAQLKCEDNGCYLSNIDGNVSGADPIGTKNQIWHFVRQTDGSYAILSYYDDLSMDVYGAKTDNATNIQMMPYVGNTAQKFWIYSINGAYYFRPQCTEYPFTINRQNNDNLEVWYYDPAFTNKRFEIIKMDCDGNLPISIGGDFYAQMKCENNGCYLSNIDGNVSGADPIGTKNQIWHFKWQNDGSYSITSYYDNLSMDVYCSGQNNGTNIQMMPYVGNIAQKFWIYSINGAYYIQPQCTNKPFTINGQNNDNLEIWIYDSTFTNKRFDIIKMDCGGNLPINVEGNFNGDFYGKIKCNVNGKYLTNVNSDVQCNADNDSNNQIWHFKWQHDGSYSITSYEDEKSMDIYCAKQENGTNVQMMPYVGNTAQRFWIYNMNNAYYIQPLCSALPFTINENNLEIWIYDNTFENKKFDIIEVIPKLKVEGDCNNDGEFNISDVVLLQKWLLATPDVELANWKVADLYEDDMLNVFDLALMKKKYNIL